MNPASTGRNRARPRCRCRTARPANELGQIGGVDVDGEGDGDQQPAGDDERQHVGDARHHVLVDALEDAAPSAAGRGGAAYGRRLVAATAGTRRRRRQDLVARERLVDHLVAVLERLLGAGLVDPLADEARTGRPWCRRRSPRRRRRRCPRRQHVLRADRALRLDLHRVPDVASARAAAPRRP